MDHQINRTRPKTLGFDRPKGRKNYYCVFPFLLPDRRHTEMPFCTKSHKTVIQSIHTEGLCSSQLPGRACSPSFCFLSFHLPLSLSSLMTKSKQEWNDRTWWSAEAGLCRADPKTAKLPSQTVFAHETLLLHQERVPHFCWWVRNLQRTSRLPGRYDNCHST